MIGARLSSLLLSTTLALLLPTHLVGATTVQANICSLPAHAPAFSTASTSTTATSDIISGTTSASTSLTVSDNNQQVASLSSDSSGAFSLEVSLSLGTNSFSAVATNACGSVNSTGSLVITRTLPAASSSSASSTTKSSSTTTAAVAAATPSSSSSASTTTSTAAPAVLSLKIHLLNLSAAAQTASGSSTTNTSVFVEGTTTPGASVYVSDNGHQVASLTAAADGSFGVSVPLSMGRNSITVQASYNGQTTSQTITYNRKPVVLHSSKSWRWLVGGGILVFLLLVAAILYRNSKRHYPQPMQGGV